jgi:hypothetical protein
MLSSVASYALHTPWIQNFNPKISKMFVCLMLLLLLDQYINTKVASLVFQGDEVFITCEVTK